MNNSLDWQFEVVSFCLPSPKMFGLFWSNSCFAISWPVIREVGLLKTWQTESEISETSRPTWFGTPQNSTRLMEIHMGWVVFQTQSNFVILPLQESNSSESLSYFVWPSFRLDRRKVVRPSWSFPLCPSPSRYSYPENCPSFRTMKGKFLLKN